MTKIWTKYYNGSPTEKTTKQASRCLKNTSATVSFVYDTPTAQVYTGVMDSLIGQSTNLDDQVTP